MLKTAHWLDTGRKAADSPRLPVQLQQRGCTWPIHSGESCKLPRIVTIFKSREVHTDLQVWKKYPTMLKTNYRGGHREIK